MEIKCPNCHSTNIRNDSVRNNNGIIGPGCKSWVVEEKYSCNDCGVYFKPIGGLPPTEPILDDDDVKALLPADLNLAVMGHGKPERAVTGPVWVKAVDRLPDGAGRITWRWIDQEAAYIGFDGTAFVYDKGGARVDMLYAVEIEWLDESGTAYNEPAPAQLSDAVTGPHWVRGTKGFPVKKQVVAKKFISYLKKEVVGSASSATGEMICFDWGVSSVCLTIGHEELNDLVWLDESGAAIAQDIVDGKELSAYYAQIEAKEFHQLAASLRLKGDRLVSILRSLRLSVTAHPDYTGRPNEEWTDLVNASDDAILDWLERKEVKP